MGWAKSISTKLNERKMTGKLLDSAKEAHNSYIKRSYGIFSNIEENEPPLQRRKNLLILFNILYKKKK